MKIIVAIIFILVMAGYIFAVGLQEFKKQAMMSVDVISSSFRRAGSSIFDLNTDGAAFQFQKIKEEISLLQSQLPAFSRFIPLLKNLPPIFSQISELTATASDLTSRLDTLKREGGQMAIRQRGDDLIKLLENIRSDLNKISQLTIKLKSQAAETGFDLGPEINGASQKIYGGISFLDSFVSWLKHPNARHLAIIFQNPSEMRPAGGFIGSFAHLTIDQGNLINLEVNDIYDFDGQLDIKIVPPLPLQSITADWEARDANWFFDFPASARKFMAFSEQSKIYQERGVKFSGVIAVNTDVVRDIIKIIGPIEIKNRGLILNEENFLSETQRNVETEKNKNILKEATPVIFERIGKLDERQKSALADQIKFRLANKDIMVYLNDMVLNSYLQELGVGGEVTELPKDFFGEYLAVVNANIAGGKSDAFIEQKIVLASQINAQGEIINNLKINREHSGENEKDGWYRMTNQNLIQILTPAGSELLEIKGADDKKIKPPADYKKMGYKTDGDLKAIEDNGEQFGKAFFSAWLNVPAGKNKTLEINYQNPGKFNLMNFDEGQKYHFIFDKQSGVKSSLEFSIEAPPGFLWKESERSSFVYKEEKAPARLILELNLIQE